MREALAEMKANRVLFMCDQTGQQEILPAKGDGVLTLTDETPFTLVTLVPRGS
jgi:hypothetical protein